MPWPETTCWTRRRWRYVYSTWHLRLTKRGCTANSQPSTWRMNSGLRWCGFFFVVVLVWTPTVGADECWLLELVLLLSQVSALLLPLDSRRGARSGGRFSSDWSLDQRGPDTEEGSALEVTTSAMGGREGEAEGKGSLKSILVLRSMHRGIEIDNGGMARVKRPWCC